jgi:hypothetical protein
MSAAELRPPARCADVDAIAASGAFEDLALSVTVVPGRNRSRILVAAEWTLRRGYGLSSALRIGDDRVLDPQELVVGNRSAALAGAVYLRELAPLRALPRPPLLASTDRVSAAAIGCGDRATGIAWMFGWPQLFGQFVHEVAAVHPDAERALRALRNAGFAVRNASTRRPKLVATVEASMDPGVSKLVEGWFDLAFGARAQVRARDPRVPAHTTWGKGPLRPWSLRSAGTHLFGAGMGDGATRWYLQQGRPSRPQRPDLIAEVYADLGTLWRQIEPELPELAAGKALWHRMRNLSATLRLGTETLEAVAEVGFD